MLTSSRKTLFYFLKVYTIYSMNPAKFVTETMSELRQVTWPSRQKTVNLTLVVILLSLLVGSYVGLLDFGLTNLLKAVLGS